MKINRDEPAFNFAEIAVALFEHAREKAYDNEGLEVLEAQLNLREVGRRIVAAHRRRAMLLAEANAVFRAMVEHEEVIRLLIARNYVSPRERARQRERSAA